MFSSPLKSHRAAKRAQDPKDGYAELPDRADVCDTEDDSDAEVGRKPHKAKGNKRGLPSFKKQAMKRKDPAGKSEHRRDSANSIKKTQDELSQTTPTQQKTRQVFGMFGSSAGKTGGQKRRRSVDSPSPMGNADSFPDFIDYDAEDNDLDAVAGEDPSAPLARFLNGEARRAQKAVLGEADSSPDPLAKPEYSVQESVESAKQRKKKTKAHGQRNTLARPATRSLLKQQLKDQDKKKMDLRRSGRHSGASGPFYGRVPSNNASSKKKTSAAKKTSDNVIEPEEFAVWTSWSEKYVAGKVLIDLTGIDPTQHVRY